MSIVGGLVLLCLLRRVAYHYYPGLVFLSPSTMYLYRQQRGATHISYFASDVLHFIMGTVPLVTLLKYDHQTVSSVFKS